MTSRAIAKNGPSTIANLLIVFVAAACLSGCAPRMATIMFSGQAMLGDQVAMLRGHGPVWVVSIDGVVKDGFYRDCGPFVATECNAQRYAIYLPPGV